MTNELQWLSFKPADDGSLHDFSKTGTSSFPISYHALASPFHDSGGQK